MHLDGDVFVQKETQLVAIFFRQTRGEGGARGAKYVLAENTAADDDNLLYAPIAIPQPKVLEGDLLATQEPLGPALERPVDLIEYIGGMRLEQRKEPARTVAAAAIAGKHTRHGVDAERAAGPLARHVERLQRLWCWRMHRSECLVR